MALCFLVFSVVLISFLGLDRSLMMDMVGALVITILFVSSALSCNGNDNKKMSSNIFK
jgi:hypothetical protein